MQVAEQRIKDLECVLQLDSTMYDHLKLVEAENSELKETVVRQNRCLVSSSNSEMNDDPSAIKMGFALFALRFDDTLSIYHAY